MTAVSVPSWVIAVKAAPGSAALGRKEPTIRRWALEEIGSRLRALQEKRLKGEMTEQEYQKKKDRLLGDEGL